MKLNKHNAHILSIDDFWTAEKCLLFIEESEQRGYEPALVQTDKGQIRVEGVRNNQRVIFTDNDLANEIWEGAKCFIPPKLGNSFAIGLNEMFRFYKYEPGQEFKKHRDQSFIRNETEASYYTLMIYLNDDFVGGETSFSDATIHPKIGSCLLFFHDLEHEGTILTEGTKYVLRTDVMYKLEK